MLFGSERFPEKDLSFAYSPENLRLGKAIEAFQKQDRIVAGVRRDRDRMRLERLFSPITTTIEWMSVESAEMTKHANNAFLATSNAFTNEVASICERVGAGGSDSIWNLQARWITGVTQPAQETVASWWRQHRE